MWNGLIFKNVLLRLRLRRTSIKGKKVQFTGNKSYLLGAVTVAFLHCQSSQTKKLNQLIMKKSIFATALIALASVSTVAAQRQRTADSAGREEFIEVEKNVRLHVTDLGNGNPIVLIHGWP